MEKMIDNRQILTSNKQILSNYKGAMKRVNKMLNDKEGLSESEMKFLSGLRKYYQHAKKFSNRQLDVLNEIYYRYLKTA